MKFGYVVELDTTNMYDMGLEKVKNTYSTILTIINNYRQCITI